MPFPTTGDTILRDAGGIRSALADIGIGVIGLSSNQFMYDLTGNNGRAKPQLYNGQRPTYNLSQQTIVLTYDMSRVGLKGGQFQFQLSGIQNGLTTVNGPRDTRIETLSYYQTLFDDAVEVKFGIIDNAQEFLGLSVGGSLASGSLGPQASIPFQVGLTYNGFGTPALNIKVNGPNHFYNKFGIQRSLPPGGNTAEKAVNEDGLTFAPRGTRPLLVNEMGYNRPAAPGQRSLWIRGGGLYNFTKYTDYRTGLRSKENWAMYLAADHQLTQTDPALPHRGIYGGLTANIAPKNQNLYTGYVEGRLYGIGLLDKRPFDLAALVVSYNSISDVARHALTPVGQRSDSWSLSAIASYSYRLMPGLYVQPGLGVVVNPSFTPRLEPAVNAYLGITALF